MAGTQLEPLVAPLLSPQKELLSVYVLRLLDVPEQLGKALDKVGMHHLPLQPAGGEILLVNGLPGQQ